ncbi:Dcp1-like decapping family-domain-containing protein [Russula brevipes]|nr:Dcp1-like decapping family-domain-containing protein [Russula brevipes]
MSPPKPPPQSESPSNPSSVAKPHAQSTSALTAAARYERNLKILRRVDPTIVSIIDQFSHVCLYRLHEGKWAKDGFEGASFLIERAAYPSYGLFILNRAGMHDYIHFIHPEDEIQAEGEYLMYRSYPEFTAKRLAMANSPPTVPIDSWTDAHRRAPSAGDPLTNWRYLLNQKPDKGAHETVMFWFLGSDSEQHEPLSDTIGRQVHIPVDVSNPC